MFKIKNIQLQSRATILVLVIFSSEVVWKFKIFEFQNGTSNTIWVDKTISNEKGLDYKVVDCFESYSFDIKLVFVQFYL